MAPKEGFVMDESVVKEVSIGGSVYSVELLELRPMSNVNDSRPRADGRGIAGSGLRRDSSDSMAPM